MDGEGTRPRVGWNTATGVAGICLLSLACCGVLYKGGVALLDLSSKSGSGLLLSRAPAPTKANSRARTWAFADAGASAQPRVVKWEVSRQDRQGPCPAEPPLAGGQCSTNAAKCLYRPFCCPACGPAHRDEQDCSLHALWAVCTTELRWVVVERGDWCPECRPALGAGTCDGFCGGVGSTGECFCHEGCEFWGSCCADFSARCQPDTRPAAHLGGSCKGRCGGAGSSFDCFCDSACVEEGTCCGDFEAECRVRAPGKTRAPPLRTARGGWWWMEAPEPGDGEGPVPALPDTGGLQLPLPPPDHAPAPALDELTRLAYPPGSFPILLLANDRYDSLHQTLQSLKRVVGFDRSNLIVSQEDNSSEFVAMVIRAFGLSPRNWLRHQPSAEEDERITSHYQWAINQAFGLRPEAKYLVIIEDDSTFSPDFLLFFSHVAPLLDGDPTLWAASAWSDNSFGHAADPTKLLRTDWFAGFGWLLSRELFFGELNPRWPQARWNDWMRDPEVTRLRETVFPEVSRIYHTGNFGTGPDFETYQRYYSSIQTYVGPGLVGFEDVRELELARYEARLQGLVRTGVAVDSVVQLADPPNADVFTLFFDAPRRQNGAPDLGVFDGLADVLGIWPSSPGMVPRGSHNGLVQLRLDTTLLLLIPSCSPYFALKPPSAVVIARSHLPAAPAYDERGSVVEGDPPFQLVGGIAPKGRSCNDACAKLKFQDSTFVCDARGFPWLNNCHQLERAFECSACVASTGPDQPALDVAQGEAAASKRGVCLWTNQADWRCSASHPKTRRLCPCRAK